MNSRSVRVKNFQEICYDMSNNFLKIGLKMFKFSRYLDLIDLKSVLEIVGTA